MRRRMLPGSLEEQHLEEIRELQGHRVRGPLVPILLSQGKLEPSALNRPVGDDLRKVLLCC